MRVVWGYLRFRVGVEEKQQTKQTKMKRMHGKVPKDRRELFSTESS